MRWSYLCNVITSNSSPRINVVAKGETFISELSWKFSNKNTICICIFNFLDSQARNKGKKSISTNWLNVSKKKTLQSKLFGKGRGHRTKTLRTQILRSSQSAGWTERLNWRAWNRDSPIRPEEAPCTSSLSGVKILWLCSLYTLKTAEGGEKRDTIIKWHEDTTSSWEAHLCMLSQFSLNTRWCVL